MVPHPPVIMEGQTLSAGKQVPVKTNGSAVKEVQVNEVLTHPMAAAKHGNGRDKWRYRFLRVTRSPTPDRPDSGRIIVENEVTGRRTEHYALLFNVKFQGV